MGAKIKDESFNKMLKEELEVQKRHSIIFDHKVLKDVVEFDEFGNKKIVQKLVNEDGPKHAPKSKNLKVSTITVIDSNGNEDQKRHSFIIDQKVLKDVIEIDEFGDKKIVQKLVNEDGPKHVPKSKNLKASTITVIDSNGNEVQKSVFIDDQGNIVDENDIDYIEESYIDEFGNKITKKVAKIKDESFNKMLKEVLKDVIEIDEFGDKKIVQKLVNEDGPKHVPKS